MLYEFCHFASTDRALESTTPSELLTPFILVFITNLTKVCASWYLGSQSILRVYINHQVHGCILQRCHSKASTQIVLWNDSFPRSKYLLGSYLPYLFGSQRLMSVSCPPCPIRFIMVDLCLDFGSFFFFSHKHWYICSPGFYFCIYSVSGPLLFMDSYKFLTYTSLPPSTFNPFVVLD